MAKHWLVRIRIFTYVLTWPLVQYGVSLPLIWGRDMKISKKIQRRLERRLSGHKDMSAVAERRKTGTSKGFRAPGSRNPRKMA